MPAELIAIGLIVMAAGVAAAIAVLAGIVVAAWLGSTRLPGKRLLVGLAGAATALFLPGAGAALLWLIEQRGGLDAATTLAVAVLGEAVLAVPLVALLATPALAAQWARYGHALTASGAGRWQARRLLAATQRRLLAVLWLVALARSLLDIAVAFGASLVVGLAGPSDMPMAPIAVAAISGTLPLALLAAALASGLWPPADPAVPRD